MQTNAVGVELLNGVLVRMSGSLPGTIAFLFVLAAGTHVLFRAFVRRKVRQDQAAGANERGIRHWLTVGLADVTPAVLSIVWVHAVFAAVEVLLQHSAPALAGVLSEGLGWGYGLGLLGAMFWLFSRVGRLIETFLLSLSRRLDTAWDDVMLPAAGRVMRRMLPLVGLLACASLLPVSPRFERAFQYGASLLLIGMAAFLLYQLVDAAAELIVRRHRIDVSDNLQARAIHTQVMVLKKVATAAIGVFALASMLMVFESARQFGASLLASAGIAGIIVGFAAQRSIATLLAGFQIALTQPIRVDDVVIVENEWGRIEEITLTYVVVRIWDLRRLVLPIAYFIEQPFQNWTRSSSEILAPVFFHADYSVPLEAVRSELTRVLAASPFWDGKVNALQVTAAKEHALEIRALASAADASQAWDLRCEVREKLIGFLQQHHPECLPRVRTVLEVSSFDASVRGGAHSEASTV